MLSTLSEPGIYKVKVLAASAFQRNYIPKGSGMLHAKELKSKVSRMVLHKFSVMETLISLTKKEPSWSDNLVKTLPSNGIALTTPEFQRPHFQAIVKVHCIAIEVNILWEYAKIISYSSELYKTKWRRLQDGIYKSTIVTYNIRSIKDMRNLNYKLTYVTRYIHMYRKVHSRVIFVENTGGK